MSDLSSDSDSEIGDFSSDTTAGASDSEYEIEVEEAPEIEDRDSDQVFIHGVDRDRIEAYRDETIATPEWLENYQDQKEKADEEISILKQRFDKTVATTSWCKCGYCAVDNLENAKECKCCTELQKCSDALQDKWVQEECEEELVCITQHPGFRVVCLERWSLRLAADKYKTLQNKRYKDLGVERRFLHAVSYREFTRLVHGRLGNRRIPLPACAYDQIRKMFCIDGDMLVGYGEKDT